MSKETSIEYLVKKVMFWEKDHERWIEMPTQELLSYANQAKAMEIDRLKNENTLRRQVQYLEAIAHHAVNYVPEDMKPGLRSKINYVTGVASGGGQ